MIVPEFGKMNNELEKIWLWIVTEMLMEKVKIFQINTD